MAESVADVAALSSTLTSATVKDTPLEKWTSDTLRAYLRLRGLTYSDLRKADLIAIPPTYRTKSILRLYIEWLTCNNIRQKLSLCTIHAHIESKVQ